MRLELIEAHFCAWWATQGPGHRSFFNVDHPEAHAALNALPLADQEAIFALAARECAVAESAGVFR